MNDNKKRLFELQIDNVFTLGSLIKFCLAIFLTFFISYINRPNKDVIDCDVRLYVIEDSKRELNVKKDDAQSLCKEYEKVKKNNYGSGDFVKPERRFLLYINGEEIVIDPFVGQYAINNHSVFFSEGFHSILDVYINFINIRESGSSTEYVGNLTYDERKKIFEYFLREEYKYKRVNYSWKRKYRIEISKSIYYFDDFNGLFNFEGSNILVDEEIVNLVKKAIEG